ncbi:alpha/beta hydrolase [Levilactobacillus zymae]|uniref:Acyltransferase n=1 Tax=Levilactobacillus zymae TaxID=267363 RepID=A0A1Y6JX02_9LACO|nr:alpha/beta hydrolase [Levilactobacillus zymae]KRL08741.1 alpha beta hydrolase [Levilactobacillus zymae DSM 19395]QFR61577.1 alpha/beta hydrolase [Levilactobacillus zymae]GEO72145.1 acyltransferase [Levilactobacillus zymae]SMS13363.1 cell surface hydrolase (putative) [Levilactobacillus zymae]
MRRKLTLGGLAIVLVLAIFIPSVLWLHQRVAHYKTNYRTPLDPTIMVPGSSASQDRFDTLITQLREETKTAHSVLKVKVATNGQLSYTGSIRRGDNQPFIVIAFENNHDGYSNINKQAQWLNVAFKALVKTYHFNHFSALGHSNGGLILSLFLEKYFAQTPNVTIDRLMTIATPYNMESDSTTTRTDMLKELIAGRSKLPKKLTVYSVAGTENYSSDGTVPANSVNQGKYVFQHHVAHYTQITVTGDDTTHSDLPQNKQIVLLIRQYLLQENVPEKSPTKKRRRVSQAADARDAGLQ